MEAGLWGLFAGGALVLGAGIAWLVRVPPVLAYAVMAFGAGVLVSALAFDLVDEAADTGGVLPTVLGFLAGALAYVGGNVLLARRGARHRKRSGDQQKGEQGSGTAIALGALLDGVPESVVLGLSLLGGHGVGVPVLAAVFISNLPEGLSSTVGMKRAGRSSRFVFGVWIAIALAAGLAGAVGVLLLEGASDDVVAAITAVAAGAILAMIADTMIPEAFEETQLWTGLIATLGFITAFAMSRGA